MAIEDWKLSPLDCEWMSYQEYVRQRIASIFQITPEEIGVITDQPNQPDQALIDQAVQAYQGQREIFECKPHFEWVKFRIRYDQAAMMKDNITLFVMVYRAYQRQQIKEIKRFLTKHPGAPKDIYRLTYDQLLDLKQQLVERLAG